TWVFSARACARGRSFMTSESSATGGSSDPWASISAPTGPSRSRSASWRRFWRCVRLASHARSASGKQRSMPAPEVPTAAVGLAAGSSTRMGRNKLLLPVAGETLVRRSVRTAIEAGLDPVVVVLGHEAERVRADLVGFPCAFVLNVEHARGAGTSLRAGARAVRETAAAALVVLLADMPYVTPASIRKLVIRHRESGAPLVLSRYGDVDAPPTLYDRALFDELAELGDGQCGKNVVRRHRDAAEGIVAPEAELRDVDVEGDYESVLRQSAEA